MNNPLKPVVFVSLLNSAYRIYQIMFKDIFSLFGIIALVLSSIFIFLYFKNSKYAGAFLFYSAVPLYPLYFLAGFLGLNATLPSVGLYSVMALIDVACLFIVWKLKNKYELYLQDQQMNTTNETSV
ncbi:MAG: hypothetical protein M3033_10940 [Acidobacteriota bacterium]|nr:hypothetical protein [Acidobacteriota bacterium]